MWPIILCPGRTARPSTCQSRTSDSQGCGSVKPPCARSVSTNRPSWVVVATYAQTMPPGRERLGDGVDALPRREHVEDHPVDALAGRRASSSARSPTVQAPGRVVAAEELGDVAPGDVGELLAALVRRHPAVGPTARSSEQVSAPDPTPASTTRAPGKMSAIATIWAASLG